MNDVFGVSADDRILVLAPQTGGAGYSYSVALPALTGAEATVTELAIGPELVDRILAVRPTVLVAVPTQMTRLLDAVGGMLKEPAKLVGPKDALLVVSFKNYTPEVVEIAQACRGRKVPVIAITDNALSPLARSASVCFQVEEKTSCPFRMLVAPMCLAQALVVALGEHLDG